jgi:hypothetical protein
MNYIFTSGTYLIQNDIDWDKVNYNNVYIVCDTSSAPVNIILPEITDTPYLYTRFLISDRSNNASVNNITISTSGSDLINGNATSIVINTNNGSVICFQICANINIQGGAPISSKWVALQSNQSGGGGGGGFTTADNGLTANTATNVRLGGTLIQNTTIDGDSYRLDIFSNSLTPSSYLLGIKANGGGTSIYAETSNGLAVSAKAISGYAYEGLSYDNYCSWLIRENLVTPPLGDLDVLGILKLERNTTGTPFGGIGGSIDFWIEPRTTIVNPAPTTPTNRVASAWVDPGPTASSRLSRLDFYGHSNLLSVRNVSIRGDGLVSFIQYDGSGTFTGTPVKTLSVDGFGNVIETDTTGVNLTDTGFIFPTTPI